MKLITEEKNLTNVSKLVYIEESQQIQQLTRMAKITLNTTLNRRQRGVLGVQLISVSQLCLILCNLMDCSTPDLPVHHQFPELTQLMSTESVMPFNLLILCHPLLLLLSIFPSIRVFSNESVLCIRCWGSVLETGGKGTWHNL